MKFEKFIDAANGFAGEQNFNNYRDMVRNSVTVENGYLVGYRLSSDMVKGLSREEGLKKVSEWVEMIKNRS